MKIHPLFEKSWFKQKKLFKIAKIFEHKTNPLPPSKILAKPLANIDLKSNIPAENSQHMPSNHSKQMKIQKILDNESLRF